MLLPAIILMVKPAYKEKVFHSMDEVERTYFPIFYAKKQEEEKLARMTPKQRGKYLGEKWAKEILAEIEKAST